MGVCSRGKQLPCAHAPWFALVSLVRLPEGDEPRVVRLRRRRCARLAFLYVVDRYVLQQVAARVLADDNNQRMLSPLLEHLAATDDADVGGCDGAQRCNCLTWRSVTSWLTTLSRSV